MGGGVRVVRKLTWVFSAYVGDTKWLHGLDLSLRTTSARKTGHGPDGRSG